MRIDGVKNNSVTSYAGIYKLKLPNNSELNKTIAEGINHKAQVLRTSKVFRTESENYMYVITRDDKLADVLFEESLSRRGIAHWKSIPVIELLDKKMIDKLFQKTEKIQGKENWINV